MSTYFKSDWQLQAPCGQVDPDKFLKFGKVAAEVCDHCPVRRECLEHALESPWEPSGVWGGLPPKAVTRQWRQRHPRATRSAVYNLMGAM